MSANSMALVSAEVPELSSDSVVSARFLVLGEADPGLLPRLLEPFSKLGTVPTRVHASRENGDGSVLSVDLRLADVPYRTAELIENALRRILGVSQIIAAIESQVQS